MTGVKTGGGTAELLRKAEERDTLGQWVMTTRLADFIAWGR